MNRFMVISVGLSICTVSVNYYFGQPNTREKAIDFIQQEIQVCKSLHFAPSDALIMMLTSYLDELQQANNFWTIPWIGDQVLSKEKLAELTQINEVMLKSYVSDMQKYKQLHLPLSSTLISFAYDKIVRLTIALEQLQKEEISDDECMKKIERMCEISKQAIAHSKKTLRAYIYDGLPDTDPRMQDERQYLMDKMYHLIALDRMVHF